MYKKYFIDITKLEDLLQDWEGPDLCIASDRIAVDGLNVGYCYREEPDFETEFGLQDSGWRFFSGDESDTYINKPSNHGIYKLNTLLNFDETVKEILNSPYGKKFKRNSEEKLVEIIEFEEEKTHL